MRTGLWSLELFMNHEKMLTDQAHQQAYENLFTQLLQLAINLLNTDKPRIGRPIIEFLSHWLLALKKLETLPPLYLQALIEIFNVTYSRLCYPKWYKFNSDTPTEYEDDFLKYREELVVSIFTNLANINSFKTNCLKMLGEGLA